MRPAPRDRLHAAFEELSGRPRPGFRDRVQRSLGAGRPVQTPERGRWAAGLAAASLAAAVVFALVFGMRTCALKPSSTAQPASAPQASATPAQAPKPGTVSRVAGSGMASSQAQPFPGDGGPALQASLGAVSGLAVDPGGNIVIADNLLGAGGVPERGGKSEIRQVQAGTGTIKATVGPFDKMWVTGLAVDDRGDIFLAIASKGEILERVAATGEIRTLASGGPQAYSDGVPNSVPASTAGFRGITGIALDRSGNVYVAETVNNAVREVVVATGTVKLVAGTGRSGYSGDGGSATAATLNQPTGVAVDRAGNIYIADRGNRVVRAVSTDGRIRTVAGTGRPGYSGDGGPANQATLIEPNAVAADGNGNLYISDSGSHVVREVLSSGAIWTVAGSGRAPQSSVESDRPPQSLPARQVDFTGPDGLSLGPRGQVYIASGNLVWKLTPAP